MKRNNFRPNFGDLEQIKYLKTCERHYEATSKKPVSEINYYVEVNVYADSFKCSCCNQIIFYENNEITFEEDERISKEKIQAELELKFFKCNSCKCSYIISNGSIYFYAENKNVPKNQLSIF